jgi:hypothetical protein
MRYACDTRETSAALELALCAWSASRRTPPLTCLRYRNWSTVTAHYIFEGTSVLHYLPPS